MKILVVGANHAGTSFLRTIKTLNPDAHVVAYDRNTNTSFLGCGIAIWVGGEFHDPSGLFYSSPEILREEYGIDLKTSHEVTQIDRANKQVVVRDLETDTVFMDFYDKLVFAGGTWPIEGNFPGREYKNILLSKLYQHAEQIVVKSQLEKIQNIVVVGAGYIGVELVEAFHTLGKKITLIDIQDRVVSHYFGEELTSEMQKRMEEEGVQLRLGERVLEFKSTDGENVSSVLTDKGEYEADLVLLCIGFKPRTEMLNDVEKLPNGAIKVDKFQRSVSDENIYVIGDSAALHHCVTDTWEHTALATNAVKTGLVAALNISGLQVSFPGVVGTNAINVFGCRYASTGLTKEAALNAGYENVGESFWTDNDRPEFMQTYEKVSFKVTYDKNTLKLLGAEVGSWGHNNHTEVIYMFALALQWKLTLPEVALTDVFFLPHFNKPFNFFLVPLLNALGIKYKK